MRKRGQTQRALIVYFAALVLALTLVAGFGIRTSRVRASANAVAANGSVLGLPRVMLWAWERPEDLRFLDSRAVGVAFLAGTIEMGSSGGVTLRPRMQPLEVKPGTALMAVVRFETPNDLWHRKPGWRHPAAPYTKAQRVRAAEIVASLAQLEGVRAVQVDYDATKSEQGFYRQLLSSVRRRLPAGMPLSITALASWCLGDPWIESLPAGTIDEAVPMLFRMGPDGPGISGYLESGGGFRAPACRGSLGVSTDEELSRELLAKGMGSAGGASRIYVFSNRAWTQAAVQRIVTEAGRWDGASQKSR